MNKQERQERAFMMDALRREGVTRQDAEALRRISMTLRRWYEAECGNEFGAICRNEVTGRPYFMAVRFGRSYQPIRDLEKGALKRLAAIMARYPHLKAYVQRNPRGCALYIWTPQNAADYGDNIDANYNHGIAVY